MTGRTKSFSALESFNGNWVISPPVAQQVLYDIPKTIRQKRIPTNNALHGKSRGHLSETWAETTMLSKAAHESYQKRDGQRGRRELTARRPRTNNRRSHSVEGPSTSTTSSSEYISSRENVGKFVTREVVLNKSDGDFGFTMRQIPSAMYGNKPIDTFRPTAKVPALQRLNCIDRGSLADRVGLKPGDYVLEVNKECVTCSPHQYVVRLIKSTPEILRLKVVEGSEDVFKQPYQSTLPQRSSTARNAANGNVHFATAVPRSHSVDLPHSKRSNAFPQPLLHKPTLAPHQNSNRLHSTANRRSPSDPVVANIRLSRVVDHDEVFYKSGRKQKTVSTSSSQSRTSKSDLQRIPSFSSTAVTIMSEPELNDATRITFAGDAIPRNQQKITAGGSVQGELPAHWSGSSVDDSNPTYDRVRPVAVPFDTDEGYIRLSGNVDYVAQAAKEQEQVDFLAMAEKARQMYLRTKSVSQTK